MFCNTTAVFLISISYLTNQYPDPDMLCYGGLSKRWEWFDLFGGIHPSEKKKGPVKEQGEECHDAMAISLVLFLVLNWLRGGDKCSPEGQYSFLTGKFARGRGWWGRFAYQFY